MSKPFKGFINRKEVKYSEVYFACITIFQVYKGYGYNINEAMIESVIKKVTEVYNENTLADFEKEFIGMLREIALADNAEECNKVIDNPVEIDFRIEQRYEGDFKGVKITNEEVHNAAVDVFITLEENGLDSPRYEISEEDTLKIIGYLYMIFNENTLSKFSEKVDMIITNIINVEKDGCPLEDTLLMKSIKEFRVSVEK